jgi:hypothetical protein
MRLIVALETLKMFSQWLMPMGFVSASIKTQSIIFNERNTKHMTEHTHTDTVPDIFFYMNLVGQNLAAVTACINQGIDSRLEGFTADNSDFYSTGRGLYCEFYNTHGLQIMIRRLLELENESAESLADTIIFVQYGYEVI